MYHIVCGGSTLTHFTCSTLLYPIIKSIISITYEVYITDIYDMRRTPPIQDFPSHHNHTRTLVILLHDGYTHDNAQTFLA